MSQIFKQLFAIIHFFGKIMKIDNFVPKSMDAWSNKFFFKKFWASVYTHKNYQHMSAFALPILMRRQTIGFGQLFSLACDGVSGGDRGAWQSSSLILSIFSVQPLGCCTCFLTCFGSNFLSSI